MAWVGIVTALASPLTMTIGFIVWESHWKGNPLVLNAFKGCVASIGFAILTAVYGNVGDWSVLTTGYLILSSTIGIIIGDWTWLKGLEILGARRVILIDACKPFCAALLGYLVLDEDLAWPSIVGIIATVTGIVIVSYTQASEDAPEQLDDEGSHATSGENVEAEGKRKEGNNGEEKDASSASGDGTHTVTSNMKYGYALSALNVWLDTYGSLIIKQYASNWTVWEINLIRFGFAGVVLALACSTGYMANWGKDHSKTWYALPNMTTSNWLHVIVGVALVTFITPALSNTALLRIQLAFALTLGSVGPLYALLLTCYKEPITFRAAFGSLVTVLGVIILSLWGRG